MIRNAAVATLALLAACSTSDPADTPIAGSWRIEDIDGGGVIDSSRLEIQFDEAGRVSGHAGCNTFTGPYTHNGAAMDIGPLASTRRACAAEALTLQEARVLRSLDAVTALAFTPDGALVLSGPVQSRLLLRRLDDAPLTGPAAPLRVSGEVFFLERMALPPDAIVRVTAQDVSRMDAAAPTLVLAEASAASGSTFAFTLDIPRERLTPQSRVAVRAQILSGYAILFTSTEHYGVVLDAAQTPLRIRVSRVADTGTGAGGHPVTPSPQAYVCGGERIGIAFEAGGAFVTFEGGESVRLDRLRAQSGDDPEAPRLFSNGRVTVRQETEGMAGPAVAFARGRMAFAACKRA